MKSNATTYSPGPYKTVRGVRKHREAIFIKSGEAFIGKVYGHQEQPVEANAALFKAAPDMFAALKRAESLLHDYQIWHDDGSRCEALQEEVRRDLLAAIAKATTIPFPKL